MEYFHLDCFSIRAVEVIPAPIIKDPEEAALPGRSGNMLLDSLESLIEAKFQSLVDELEVPAQIKTIEIKLNGEVKRLEGKILHKSFETLLKLLAMRENVYLYGAPGSGKSTAACLAAEALGRSYGYSSLNPQSVESRLIGYMDATGNYRASEFHRIYVAGGVYCLDELDNASPSLLTTLNSLLENGHGSFPNGTHTRHGDFSMVGTGNTLGDGADMDFPDRRVFDSAFKERFIYLEWDYDLDMERAIMASINNSKAMKTAYEWMLKLRVERVSQGIRRVVISPRAVFKTATLLGNGFTLESIMDMVIFKGNMEAKEKLLRVCPVPAV